MTKFSWSYRFLLLTENEEIPSMAVLALFIETIDGIAYFAIAILIFSHLSDIIYLTEGILKL